MSRAKIGERTWSDERADRFEQTWKRGGVAEDTLLKKDNLEPVRDRLLADAAEYDKRLRSQLSGQADWESRRPMGQAWPTWRLQPTRFQTMRLLTNDGVPLDRPLKFREAHLSGVARARRTRPSVAASSVGRSAVRGAAVSINHYA